MGQHLTSAFLCLACWVQGDIRELMQSCDYLAELVKLLRALHGPLLNAGAAGDGDLGAVLERVRAQQEKKLHSLEAANALSAAEKRRIKEVIKFLRQVYMEVQREQKMRGSLSGADGFALIKTSYEKQIAGMRQKTEQVQQKLHHLFSFVQKAFADGNEMLILVTHLTVNEYSARFIGIFGCPDYQKHNQELMLSERQASLQREIAELEL